MIKGINCIPDHYHDHELAIYSYSIHTHRGMIHTHIQYIHARTHNTHKHLCVSGTGFQIAAVTNYQFSCFVHALSC